MLLIQYVYHFKLLKRTFYEEEKIVHNKISQSTKVKSCNLGLEIFVQYPPSTKVIIHKSRGEVSLVEQDTIEYVS